jgi:serine/threonine protein phosphatase 1
MRILAIGDIHGCSIAFNTLLELVNPQPEDLIITLGDYVDRGPDSKGVIEKLLKLHQEKNVVSLKGNHEIMMLEARKGQKEADLWLSVGGLAALFSYSGTWDSGKLTDIPEEHWNFLEYQCVNYWETENHIFVHANVNPELPLSEQPEGMLFWRKFSEQKPHYSGKTMICGHTRQTSGQPLYLDHGICIDTWVYGEGWLTCLDVISGKIWQTNQKGEYQITAIEAFRPSSRIKPWTKLFASFEHYFS